MTKRTNDLLTIVGLLIGAAGTFGTFATLPISFESKLGISHDMLLLLGKALLLIGLGIIMIAGVSSARNSVRPKSCKLGLQAASKRDLKEVHALYEAQFGPDAPVLAKMRSWYKCNHRIFQIVVAVDPRTRRRKIVASFKAVPLKNEAIAHLEMEHMTGNTLLEHCIVRPRGRPKAWYFGDLVSTSPASARAVMKELRDYVLRNVASDVPIYARALTEDGLHYLQKFHFTPVGETPIGIGPICRLLAADMPEMLAELRSHAAAGKRRSSRGVADQLGNGKADLETKARGLRQDSNLF